MCNLNINGLVNLVLVATAVFSVTSCGSNQEQDSTQPITDNNWTFADDTASGIEDGNQRRPGDVNQNPKDTLTADTTIVDSSQDSTSACTTPCSTNEQCALNDDQQAPCANARCEAGCCVVDVDDQASLCDDADPCTNNDQCNAQGACIGAAIVCDDSLDCTTDTCQAGACVFTPTNEFVCVIDGLCYAGGDLSPSQTCQVCEPKSSQTSWSFAPGCCKSNADCPSKGPCDQPACDASTGTCKSNLAPGCCTQQGDCDDGDVCTDDTCDVATNSCSYAPKDCTDGLPCVTGSCISGACKKDVKPGFCVLDGLCVADGSAKQGEPCKICSSTTETNAWTIEVGETCDDGSQCTSGDVCDAAGACKGTPVQGCCSSDKDCATLNDACTTATCELATGNCVKTTLPGCCLSGPCCDLTQNLAKSKGTQCGATKAATQYQCNGLKVEEREVYDGCDGLLADKCSSDPANQFVGTWKFVKSCTDKQICKEKGSGIEPECVKKPPTGTCVNACGGPAADGTCTCGPSCVTLGTCCTDYSQTCACTQGECCDVTKKFLKPGGVKCSTKTEYQCSGQIIQKRSLESTCTGTSPTCSGGKLGPWSNVQTCSATTTCTVAANKASASCKPKTVGGSCVGKCGGQSTGCWCDSQCATFGDCCGDYQAVCAGGGGCGANPASTCKSKCGGQGTGGCYCDAACAGLGDCCKDKTLCCG